MAISRMMMQRHGIRAAGKRCFRVVTTDSGHDLPIALDLLNRNFHPEAPNRAWSGGITHLGTEEGWLFLAVAIDPFSRKVGCSMRPDMHRGLVVDALEMGVCQRRPPKGQMSFHSDRDSQYRGPRQQAFVAGVEYASEDFRHVLEKYGLQATMSRKRIC